MDATDIAVMRPHLSCRVDDDIKPLASILSHPLYHLREGLEVGILLPRQLERTERPINIEDKAWLRPVSH